MHVSKRVIGNWGSLYKDQEIIGEMVIIFSIPAQYKILSSYLLRAFLR